MASTTFTREEVAKHNTAEDCWIIIDSKVYDVTKFLRFHPGGDVTLLTVAGKEATDVFFGLHRIDVLKKYTSKFLIGTIQGEKSVDYFPKIGEFSKVPYAEPSAWQGFSSPYYNDSHKRFKLALRKFFEEEIRPTAARLDEKGTEVPESINQICADAGVLPTRVGPGSHLKGRKLIGGVKPEEFDYFHELIAAEETTRLGCPGYLTGIFGGLVIGLPPVFRFGNSEELKQRVIDDVYSGRKRICLAISDPYAGSDVAQITCLATKTPCGKFYIVNGMKKWITGGSVAHYFTTAVRTKVGAGMKGISLLLIERGPGVTTTKIDTSYSKTAGTAYVFFKNVKVPVENLLGREHHGFKYIMANFNHERWGICCVDIANTRLVVEECFKWANQRKVFGKNLLSQPVIRAKLARMISELESTQSWLENITYQMVKMSYKEQTKKLSGPIALLKLKVTRLAFLVNDEACQIFGGRAVTRGGMGQVIERNQRSVKFGAILGGSEEIMADLGIRQAIKYFPKNARL